MTNYVLAGWPLHLSNSSLKTSTCFPSTSSKVCSLIWWIWGSVGHSNCFIQPTKLEPIPDTLTTGRCFWCVLPFTMTLAAPKIWTLHPVYVLSLALHDCTSGILPSIEYCTQLHSECYLLQSPLILTQPQATYRFYALSVSLQTALLSVCLVHLLCRV